MKKRWIWVLLAALVAMYFGRQRLLDPIVGASVARDVASRPHLGFSTGELFKDSEESIMEAAALPYDTVWLDDYRGTLHYDSLTEQEQTVYRALEYAMEEGYTNVLVDDLLVSDSEVLEKVLQCFALDSPLLEQNLRYQTGTFTAYHTADVYGIYDTQVEFDGFYITVRNFSSEHMLKKQMAMKKAQDVVSQLPEGLSQAEKAEKLYRYLCDTVTYQLYDDPENKKVYAYLYDGLIKGKTQCDGFANSLTMLYRMAGINCVEKEYKGKSKDEVGHTWNFFQLDGQWYNADAVGGAGKSGEMKAYYFGYPDLLQGYVPEYAKMYPQSKKGLKISVDAHLASNSGLSNALTKAYKAHNKNWALIVVDKITEKQIKSAAQSLANNINGSVRYRCIELPEGRTALWFYREKYFK